jgi:cholesterol transport system auxiliary component
MRRHILLFLLAAVLAACTPTQQPSIPVRYSDFGPEPGRNLPKIPVVLQVANITAPEWLESNTIPYRLLYQDPLTVNSYAITRWVAAPNSLLTIRLKHAVGGGAGVVGATDSVRTGCVLRVALEDFGQVFDAPQASRVTIRARASLVSNDGKNLLSQKTFSMDRPAATPDVNGAVTALAGGADSLVGDIMAWLVATLDAGSLTGQAAIKHCKGS